MDSSQIIYIMISICIVGVLLLIFHRQLKFFLKIALNAVIGIGAIFIFNIFTGMFGLMVGINLLTVLIAGLLGIPGVVSLYVMQSLL